MFMNQCKYFQFRDADHTHVSVLALVCCDFIVSVGRKDVISCSASWPGRRLLSDLWQLHCKNRLFFEVFDQLSLKGTYYAH